jgi:DNA-binding transcriptional MerR regulator
MNQQMDLLSIGSFASMTRLSIKALRLYDQLNILTPHHVDPQSGYRYYGPDQLRSARMIRALRDMDMPLATIRQVLAAFADSPAHAEALVDEYLQMRERGIKQVRKQVHYFIQLLQQEAIPMSHEVNVRKIAPQQVISVTRHVKVDKLDEAIRQSLQELETLINEQGGSITDFPLGIYHGTINEQDEGPIEICIPTKGNVKGKGEMIIKQLDGGNAVSVIMLGKQCDFPEILDGYDSLADWIHKNGYEMAGPPREVWHSAPGKDAKMEIMWLFKQ